MSFEAISWALKQDIARTTEKFCLVMMANYAGYDGLCYPSIDRLSLDMSQDRKTVMKSIQSLIEAGYLEDTSKRVGATKSVIVYRLAGFPTEGKTNYLYKVINPETDEYYVGIRAFNGDPLVDSYLGSGAWVKEMKEKGVFLEKTILETFDTYEEARAAESKFFRSMTEDDGFCRNLQTTFMMRKAEKERSVKSKSSTVFPVSSTVFPLKQYQKRYIEPITNQSWNQSSSDLDDPVLRIFENYEEKPETEDKYFWDQAVGMLMGLGVADITARTFVKKCLKLANGDKDEILRILQVADNKGVRDPIAYLSAALGGKQSKERVTKNQQIAEAFAELEAASERKKAQWAKEYGLDDIGGVREEDHVQLQPKQSDGPTDIPQKRSRGVRKVSARRIAQIIGPVIRDTNESQVSSNDF